MSRTCKNCKTKFEPQYNSVQSVCSFECALEDGKKNRDKKWKKEKKVRSEALKTNSDYVRELQVIFNKFIRLRDKDNGCISCNKPLSSKYDAGHYYSTGSYPELRFNENNVHAQCVFCNQHKHGNLLEYRIQLKKRIPVEDYVALNMMKGHPRKYTIPELKALKIKYKEKIKML